VEKDHGTAFSEIPENETFAAKQATQAKNFARLGIGV